jgi:fumarate hydratase class I
MPLYESLLELLRRTSSDLPKDIRDALARGSAGEAAGTAAANALGTVARNVEQAALDSAPICQDTGMIKFYVTMPAGYDTLHFEEEARRAVVDATRKGYLRQNSVDSLTGKNSGTNLGPGTPIFHFEAKKNGAVTVRLMLKGGGCENCGAQYALPAELKEFSKRANRDLDGVRLAVLHAIWKAQGKGCSPGYIGVAIGGDRASGLEWAAQQLLRTVDDVNPDPQLAKLERDIFEAANAMDVGPMGFGGRTTVLGVKIGVRNRLPASYFVSMAYACWAHRRRGCRLDAAGNAVEWLY